MKSKEQKRREAEIRRIRSDFVFAARGLEWYKRDVRAKLLSFHKDDMRRLVKKMRTAINILHHECTQDEIANLFDGWVIPDQYKRFIPTPTLTE